MNQEMKLSDIMQLIELRRNDPEGYKQFLADFKEIAKDIMDICVELANDMVI